MWIFVIALVIAVLMGRVHFGFAPPPNVRMLIRIQGDSIRITRGALGPLAKEHVAGIVMESGVTRGFIAVAPSGRIVFSRNIPPAVQQQIRNVMVNS